MESNGYEFHGRNWTISLFGGTLVFPTRRNLKEMVGFPLTPSRLRRFSTLGKFHVYGCNAKSVGGRVDAKSKQERSNQAIATSGRSPVRELDINFFPSVNAHRHETLLKAIAKPIYVTLTGTLRECEGCMVAKRIRAQVAELIPNRSDR